MFVDWPQTEWGNVMTTEIDLFDAWENMPTNLAEICTHFGHRHESGENCLDDWLEAVESIGYTFDWGLDGEPTDLRLK